MKFYDRRIAVDTAGSPPSRGAWIEINLSDGELLELCGRPPRGGRGLK